MRTGRIGYLARHRVEKAQRFALGQLVRTRHGFVGAVDKVFFDLEAAMDATPGWPADWYERQEPRPTTPKTGTWYGLVFDEGEGSGLYGEDDLEAY